MKIPLLSKLALGGLLLTAAGVLSTQAAAPPAPTGYVNFFTFAGDQRSAIQAGTAVPDGSFYPKRAEGPYNGYPGPDPGDDDATPLDIRENYNMVLKFYFYPPKDGSVQFAICTDDPGQLYVSTDDNPANKVQVASESQWNPKRGFGGAWDGSVATRRNTVTDTKDPSPRPENWSPYMEVVKGKPYYIESVGTEFGGGDNNAVAFRYKNDPEFADGDKPISGQYLAPFSMPAVATIIGQPRDAAVYVGGTATFSVAVDAPPSVTVSSIKWTRNGADVPNSDTTSLSVSAAAADDGAKYKAIITTSAGTLTSADATLNVSAFTSDFAVGVVKFEAWTGISGTAVSGLLEDAHYQDKPDDVRLLSGIDTPNGYADNYGARVTGFIIPTETASYDFFIRSDDASQFFLSSSEKEPNPATDTVTAEETGCCDAFHETGNGDAETTQAPIALVAGKKYAFIAFVKEGGGGDYVQVAMRKVGDKTPAGSLKPLSGTLIGANAKPTKGDPQITKQPVLPAKMEEGQSWSLSVDGIVTPIGYNYPILVQWQKNGVDIPGANGKTYTINSLTPADSGTYRAVLSAPSGKSVNSVDLVGTVIPDKVSPTLAFAQKSFSSDTTVFVTFSESVAAASANVAANYKINNGISVTAAALTSNPRTVALTTSAITKGSKNLLTVSGVQDLFKNVIAANSSVEIGFQKGIYLVTADPAEDGGPLTFAGDVAVRNHLQDRGFDVAVMQGARVPDDGSTAIGRDLIIETSTLGSGTVEIAAADPPNVGKFKNLAIPAIDWEASSIDAWGFSLANSAIGTIAAQTQINIVDPTHPLAAGFPKGLVTVTTPETYSQSIPTGGHIVATPASDLSYSMIYYYEKGEKGFNDFVMPEKRVFFFFQDNTAASANDNGWKLFDAAVDWSLGIAATTPPPGQPALSVAMSNGKVVITYEGTLQGSDTVNGTFADVAGATSPFTADTTKNAKFYRAKR
ncbi:MAG: hypothetical protein HY043_05005 [Verrucomicrobia bacterium]|nr:hypothetical protein [Verrucomicrobiota bacterium]